jgi:iron complex transport system ATP-binding protein
VRLLHGVSLEARSGELLGLIGPNGAGKSTLLRCISGLLRCVSGEIAVEGEEAERLPPSLMARKVAYVSQGTPNTFGFTGLEIVMMGRYARMGRFAVEGANDRRKAQEAMARTETEQFASRIVSTLSGGERQRVFLARAIAQEAPILILDEPTANLDVQHQLKVLELVSGLVREGKTAIAAVHDLPLAARFCHRLVLLHKGRILAEGRPEAVLTPANIEQAFGVRSVAYPDPLTGSLTLSLLDPARELPAPGKGIRVHLICGGGSGARSMYELQRAGFTVTACALGSGDTDRRAADILGISYVPTPAFGGIDNAAHEAHKRLVADADAVILCETPFGANNLRNLEAIQHTSRIIALERGSFTGRDFTGGQASRIYESLSLRARCAEPGELIAAISRSVAR